MPDKVGVPRRPAVEQGAQGEGDAPGQQQTEAHRPQRMPEGDEGEDTQPTHQDVDQGRVVALVLEPDTLVDDTEDR